MLESCSPGSPRSRSAPRRRRGAVAVMALAVAALAVPAAAQTWRFEPSIACSETPTNNVNLAPTDSRTSDLVTQMTPALALERDRRAHAARRVGIGSRSALRANRRRKQLRLPVAQSVRRRRLLQNNSSCRRRRQRLAAVLHPVRRATTGSRQRDRQPLPHDDLSRLALSERASPDRASSTSCATTTSGPT